MIRDLQLGKLPATHDPLDLLFRKYADLAAIIPQIPAKFGHGFAFHGDEWRMLGNDLAGDCVFAGGAHEEMLLAKVLLGQTLPFTTSSVIADYSAVTGYNSRDPNSDQGTECRVAYKFRQQVGLQDVSGTRHRIGPYMQLDPKNWDQLLAAVYVFGAVGIGFDFPETAWDQFDNGEPWDVVSKDAALDGGHYVPVVGSMLSTRQATCVTWARRQVFTREFYEEYNDETWAFVPGILRPDNTGLHHVDVKTLEADLAAIAARRGARGGRV